MRRVAALTLGALLVFGGCTVNVKDDKSDKPRTEEPSATGTENEDYCAAYLEWWNAAVDDSSDEPALYDEMVEAGDQATSPELLDLFDRLIAADEDDLDTIQSIVDDLDAYCDISDVGDGS